VWLSPIFACSYTGENMHGYDATDFFALNPYFGTQADLKRLLDEAHGRGMRVLFDFVPNHTASAHPWFQDPATRGTWYVWQPSVPAGWGLPWGGGTSSDVWRPSGGSYFYTAFSTGTMADLNYREPAVREKMAEVVRHWLDRGFDGLRMDAVRYLYEDGPGLQADRPATFAQLKAFRTVLDEYRSAVGRPTPDGDPSKRSHKVMIAEAWTDLEQVIPYFGSGSDAFHLCLDFQAPGAIASAIDRQDARRITDLWERQRTLMPAGARMAAFDSNHDNVISRPGTRYASQKRRQILAEAMTLLAPGTPILYYGNEVGLPGAAGNDLDLRRPMDWTAVQAQSADPESLLSWCRYLIRARLDYPALRGDFAVLPTDAPEGQALAMLRLAGDQRVLVVANFTQAPLTFTVRGLADQGAPANGPVAAILGDLKGRGSLSGADYTVTDLPPSGVRILHVAGPGFGGTLHGDLP